MYSFTVLTISDKGSQGMREDDSGTWICEFLKSKGFGLLKYTIVPDEPEIIKAELIAMADTLKANLVLTTGGTGFSKRDNTPEATKAVIEREAPGIPEAIRQFSMTVTKRAMLSRAVCGIRGDSLILNLPGSPKAVREALEYVLDSLMHGLDILTANAFDCAEPDKK